MLGSSVEKLFERYRSKGDAEALARVFDRTSPELFRLAQHLVRDPLQAEDVLQETFVVAIDAAERWDRERPLVPWLTGILAKQASMLRRKSRRMIEPDRLHERVEPDPADLAEDSELSRELRTALVELPELYREVLRRHLLDGSKPAEIARDLERAPGTVRMQLHRGLEQLRRALPASFAAGAALAAFSPRGLAAVREIVVAHAVESAALSGAAVATGSVATLAAWKLVGAGALALALAAGVSWRVLRDPAQDPSGAAVPSTAAAAVAPQSADASTSKRAVEQPGEDARRGPRAVLVGALRGVPPEDYAQVQLTVRGVARYAWPEALVASAAPASDGSFAIPIDGLLDHAATAGALDELELRVDHPAFMPVRERLSPAAGEASSDGELPVVFRCDVVLVRAIVLHGTVLAPLDSTSPVTVAALPLSADVPAPRLLDSTLADAQGRFSLRIAEGGDVEVLALGADTLLASQHMFVVGGSRHLVPALKPALGIRVQGRCLNAGQASPISLLALRPVTDEDASYQMRLGSRVIVATSRGWQAGEVSAEVQPDGRFELSGLAPGAHRIAPQAFLPGVVWASRALEEREFELALPVEELELDLGLGLVSVSAVDEAGRPHAGELSWSVDGAQPATRAFADGGIVLAADPGASLDLRVRVSGGAELERRAVVPAAGRTHGEVFVVGSRPRPSAVVQVLAPAGALPSEPFTIALETLGEARHEVETRKLTLEDGALYLGDLPEGALRLELNAGGAYRHYQDLWLPLRVDWPFGAGWPSRESVELLRGGRLRVSVRDGGGALLPAACRVRDLYGVRQDVRFLLRGPDEQGFSPDARLSDRGPNDVHPNLPAGVYEVELSMEGRATRVVPVRIQAGEVSDLDVTLQ